MFQSSRRSPRERTITRGILTLMVHCCLRDVTTSFQGNRSFVQYRELFVRNFDCYCFFRVLKLQHLFKSGWFLRSINFLQASSNSRRGSPVYTLFLISRWSRLFSYLIEPFAGACQFVSLEVYQNIFEKGIQYVKCGRMQFSFLLSFNQRLAKQKFEKSRAANTRI